MRKIIGWGMATIGWLLILISTLGSSWQTDSAGTVMFICAVIIVMCGIFIAERRG